MPVDKTPVFDGAARGFVYVDGGPTRKKHPSAILALFEMGAVTDVGSATKKAPPSISMAGR